MRIFKTSRAIKNYLKIMGFSDTQFCKYCEITLDELKPKSKKQKPHNINTIFNACKQLNKEFKSFLIDKN